MSQAKVLITGATGKTGFFAAKTLLEKGYTVRAMARKASATTEDLQALGAEIVYADFLNQASMESALEGIDRAYFVYPPADLLLEATVNFIVAAKAAGVKAVVNMSQLPAREHHSSHLTRQHWLSEKMLDQSDLSVTHVCPSFFSEMLYLMNGASILQEGKIYLPHGDAHHAPVTGEDIGRSVAAILDNPEQHANQRYILTGDERLSHNDIASIASDVLGMPIQYISITPEQWSDAVKQSGLMSDFLVSHLVEVGKDCANGVFDKITTTVEDLTGQKPTGMKTFLEENRSFFTPDFLQAYSEKLTAEKIAA